MSRDARWVFVLAVNGMAMMFLADTTSSFVSAWVSTTRRASASSDRPREVVEPVGENPAVWVGGSQDPGSARGPHGLFGRLTGTTWTTSTPTSAIYDVAIASPTSGWALGYADRMNPAGDALFRVSTCRR